MIAVHAPINRAPGVAHAATGTMTRQCGVSAAALPTSMRVAIALGVVHVHRRATSGKPRRVYAVARAARWTQARATDAQAQRSLVGVGASGTMSHLAAPGAA